MSSAGDITDRIVPVADRIRGLMDQYRDRCDRGTGQSRGADSSSDHNAAFGVESRSFGDLLGHCREGSRSPGKCRRGDYVGAGATKRCPRRSAACAFSPESSQD